MVQVLALAVLLLLADSQHAIMMAAAWACVLGTLAWNAMMWFQVRREVGVRPDLLRRHG